MRGLKVLVVVMGVMLVAGSAALVAAIIFRVNHRDAAPRPDGAPPARGFDRSTLDLPAGARVLSSELAGDRLVLRIGLAEGGEEIVLIDVRNGARLGTIDVRAGAGPAKP